MVISQPHIGGKMEHEQIPQVDQEWIDGMVKDYRLKITNLYKIARIQGQVDIEEKERDKLKEKLAMVAA